MTVTVVPFFVLGGYLGAGKTTLLNELLASGKLRRTAVLVNDFGDINIDAELIENQTGETLSLKGGCVCCTIQDDLGGAIEAALAMEPAPERILVEASGTADPTKVSEIARVWPGLRPGGEIVVVDACRVREQVGDKFVGRHLERQLTVATYLVPRKIDLLDEAGARDLMKWLEGVARSARLLSSAEEVLHLLTTDTEEAPSHRPLKDRTTAPAEPQLPHRIYRATFRSRRAVERAPLEDALRRITPIVERAKGIVRIESGATVLQWARGHQIEWTPHTREVSASELVVLTRRELAAAERALLDSCFP